jgi:hypothetical protein
MLIIQQALFLVGGFGENNYMKIRYKARNIAAGPLPKRKGYTISVSQPSHDNQGNREGVTGRRPRPGREIARPLPRQCAKLKSGRAIA